MNRYGIVDQSTDTSQAFIYKAASTLESKDVAETIKKSAATVDIIKIAEAASDVFAWPEQRLFPLNSFDNVLCSKVYFDAQRDLIPDYAVSKIASTLDTYIDLYDIPVEYFAKAVVKEAAQEEPGGVELLASEGMFKVASSDDMASAAEVFTKDYLNLTVPQRVEFSRNFVKLAGEMGVTEYPALISKYAAELDTDLSTVRELLLARAGTATKVGRDGSPFRKLASLLTEVDATATTSKEELAALAETIHILDKEAGFDTTAFDKRVPDAYHTVFCKQAESANVDEDKEKKTLENLDAAAILARYGEGAVDACIDEDGQVDAAKLKEYVNARSMFVPTNGELNSGAR